MSDPILLPEDDDLLPKNPALMARPGMLAPQVSGPQPIVPTQDVKAASAPVQAAAAGPVPIGGGPTPIDPRLAADQSHLDYLKRSGSGIDQLTHPVDANGNPTGAHVGIGHKILSGLARFGEIAGSALAPSVVASIPGTTLHHQMLMGQQQGQINNDLAGAKQQAETTNELAKPELAQAKIDALDAKNQAQNQHQTDTLEATLREHGFKHDDKGNVVPLPYEEMSGTQQAVHDLKASQEELADANSAYKKAQQSNIPIQMQMAAARIATAQKNAETARGRLGLGQQEFEANYMGTHNGEALAGIGTDDSGRPVGTRVANANAATSDRLKRSDLANNVIENTGAIRDLITKNPNLFGKVAGRFTTASQMIGSNDPAISALGVRIHNAALASNGAHGLRSAEAVTQTENELLNHFRNSPKATLAGLDALDDSVKTFIADAKLGKKAGGGASPKPAVKPAPGAPKPNSQNDPMGVL